MNITTLRKPCEHGRWEKHQWRQPSDWPEVGGSTLLSCQGGEFLALDTLVIEKVDGEWPKGTKQFELTDDRGNVRQYLGVDLEFYANVPDHWFNWKP